MASPPFMDLEHSILPAVIPKKEKPELSEPSHLNGPSSDLEAAFLSRDGDDGSGSPHSPPQLCSKSLPIQSLSQSLSNSFNSSYMSSDNESDIEDEDLKLELRRLREKHLKEIQDLQSRQKHEIESLYTRLGKAPLLLSSPQPPLLQGEEGDPPKAKAASLVAAVPWGIKALDQVTCLVRVQQQSCTPSRPSPLLATSQRLGRISCYNPLSHLPPVTTSIQPSPVMVPFQYQAFLLQVKEPAAQTLLEEQ